MDKSVSHARAEVREWLGADHPAYETARLVASELVTNAVRHGGQSVCDDRVIMKMAVCDDLLRLEVIDAGMTDSYPAIGGVSAASAEGGRGLFIVSHLTGGAWGFRDLGVGRLVWCEFPADPEASSAAFVPLARTG